MAIHQEVDIKGSAQAVYEILTNAEKFSQMTGGPSAKISAEEGGAVSLFGGDIRARNVELVPGKRVVQAWRSHVWPEGVYSIVRFELQGKGESTKLTFDQSGYPQDAHEMLNGGWPKMYWEPMNAMLT
jgi:activator of HSP90 ATPase